MKTEAMALLKAITRALARVWAYLLLGSDDLVLPKDWLQDKERMRQYVGYTRRQLQQGAVVTSAADMRRQAAEDQAAERRRAFWAAWADKQAGKPQTNLRVVKG